MSQGAVTDRAVTDRAVTDRAVTDGAVTQVAVPEHVVPEHAMEQGANKVQGGAAGAARWQGCDIDRSMKLVYAVLFFIASASVADACNIPVFRYALERWRPDECEIVVFCDGELNAEEEKLIASALPIVSSPIASTPIGQGTPGFGVSPSGTAPTGASTALTGARVVRADVNRLDSPYADVWAQLSADSSKSLPYVVVRAKIGTSRTINAWHGPLESVRGWDVFESPARTEMARRLLSGHSVVWLVIQSRDESRNEQLRQRLDQQLNQLADKIPLPDGIGLPGSELYSDIPLLVKFSVIEIRRDDPKEKFLIDLFSSFRPETVAEGQPLVIPVFGRGRALEVIPADDLSPRLMEDLAAFLSGACSCQVKEQNPGFDLLFAIDWNAELFGDGFEPPPAKTVGDRGQPQLLTIPPGR